MATSRRVWVLTYQVIDSPHDFGGRAYIYRTKTELKQQALALVRNFFTYAVRRFKKEGREMYERAARVLTQDMSNPKFNHATVYAPDGSRMVLRWYRATLPKEVS